MQSQYHALHYSASPTNNYIGWGESGKVILQVSIAVFWARSKKFWAQMAQPPYL